MINGLWITLAVIDGGSEPDSTSRIHISLYADKPYILLQQFVPIQVRT